MDRGIVRKMDALGRIVIPSETRRLFNMWEGYAPSRPAVARQEPYRMIPP